MKLKNFELKPCPYCGGKAELKHKREKNFSLPIKKENFVGHLENSYIRCSKCHARTRLEKNIDSLARLWNRGNIYSVK